MDKGATGWTVNTVRRHLYRFKGVHEFEDLLQDAHMVWWKLKGKYPDATPPQFMGRFKLSFLNHLNDLSRPRFFPVYRPFCDVIPEGVSEEAWLDRALGSLAPEHLRDPDIAAALAGSLSEPRRGGPDDRPRERRRDYAARLGLVLILEGLAPTRAYELADN